MMRHEKCDFLGFVKKILWGCITSELFLITQIIAEQEYIEVKKIG